MEVISFHESDRQDLWLEEIKKSDWKPGKFLYELLNQGTFFDTVGENSKVLLLIDGNELISYCTYAQKDDIQPTELTPWMGFVYTFPEHRGHRYVGLLFKEIERLAQQECVSQVYISTNSVGLYEKYGCEFLTEMKDLDGNPSRIYVKKVDVNENDTKEPDMQEVDAQSEQESDEHIVQVPEVSNQVVVVHSSIPEIKEQSTQEVESVEILDIEDDKSLVVEKSIKSSKTKKVLKYLTSKKKRAVLRRAFHLWQVKPHEVAPMSESTNECAACGTVFQGNFCPRCGQPTSVGRFSFKKALLHFLDVWGMGNRSMFRSLRDLMFRPGYMIRDYLSGMQSAYFPPFKMFFVLLTFMFIIDQGLKLDLEKNDGGSTQPKSEIVEHWKDSPDTTLTQNDALQNASVQKGEVQSNKGHDIKKDVDKIKKSKLLQVLLRFCNMLIALWDKNPAIFSLLTLVLFSWPLFFLMRHSPNIPDLRFSEFVVAMVYTSNLFTVFSILGSLLNSDVLKIISVIMILVALSQFSGYKKLRIFGYLIITLIISVILIIILASVGIGVLALFVNP